MRAVTPESRVAALTGTARKIDFGAVASCPCRHAWHRDEPETCSRKER